MKIHEYQAKQLLKQYGVVVPAGQVASNPDEVREVAKTLGKRVVIKGQVHSGGRGKAGAVKLANDANAAEAIGKDLLGKTLFFAQAGVDIKINRLLVEEAVDIDKTARCAVSPGGWISMPESAPSGCSRPTPAGLCWRLTALWI